MRSIFIKISMLLSMMLFIVNANAQNPNTLITQTVSQTLFADAVACAGAGWIYTTENQYSRVFDMSTYNTNNFDSFFIRNIEFGIYRTSSTGGGTSATFTVKIYKLNTPTYTTTVGQTLLFQKDTTLLMNLNMIKLNLSAMHRIGANEKIIVEITTPDGSTTNTVAAIGFVNENPTTYTSYIMANTCAINVPTPMAGIGFANYQALINLNGEFFNLPEAPQFDLFKDTICAGVTNVNYSVTPVPNATSYAWSFSSGGVTINGNGPNITLNASNTAISGLLKVKAVSYYGESAETSRWIQIDSVFNISLNLNHAAVCVGDSVYLEAPQGYFNYRWEPPTGLSDINTRSTWARPGNSHSYTITAVNDLGCKGVGSTYVDVNPGPYVSTYPSSLTVCSDTIEVVLSGGVSYSWFPTNGITNPVGNATKVRPSNTTNYVITAIDSMGCVRDNPVTVTVYNTNPITITRSGKILTAPNGYLSYMWYKNGMPVVPAAIFPQYNAKDAGDYYVVCVDGNGCTIASNILKYDGQSTGIDQINWDNVNLYPNPSNNKITIDTDMDIQYELYSVDGKLMIEKTQSKVVDIERFANGIYYLVVEDLATNTKGSFKVEKR
jgi:hypothetical protein